MPYNDMDLKMKLRKWIFYLFIFIYRNHGPWMVLQA